MDGVLISISGNWGHFKKPETNNNPLTHDLITKTALIGMIGAVLGIERTDMKDLFPQLSEDLLYGVEVLNEVQKESHQFTLRKAVNQTSKAPGTLEFLKNPSYTVALCLQKTRSSSIYKRFVNSLEKGRAKYNPVLGIHNCPAEVLLISKGIFAKNNGSFKTQGFVTKNHKLNLIGDESFRIGIDRMPTYQTSDFWNLPEKYVRISYPTNGKSLEATGEYYKYKDDSSWVLI